MSGRATSPRLLVEAAATAALIGGALVVGAGELGRWWVVALVALGAVVGCARFRVRLSMVQGVPGIGFGAAVLTATADIVPTPLLLASWTAGSIIGRAVLDRRLLLRPGGIIALPLLGALHVLVWHVVHDALGLWTPAALAAGTAYVVGAVLVAELQSWPSGAPRWRVLARLRTKQLVLVLLLNVVVGLALRAVAMQLGTLIGDTDGRFGTAFALLLFGLTVLAVTSAVELRRLSASYAGLTAAALQLPWPADREAGGQLLGHAASVLSADRLAIRAAPSSDLGALSAAFRDADGVEHHIVAERDRGRTPFVDRDARALRAIAHLGAETLRIRRSTSDLEREANTDELTGLPNYRAFQASLIELNASRREGASLAVVYIDLDGFKAVNDRYGHEIGNRVLQTAAHRLRGVIRPSDRPARVGGDEFVVILPDVGELAHAETVARRITESLSEPYLLGDRTVLITISTGIAHSEQPLSDPAQLVEQADERMYTARGRVPLPGRPSDADDAAADEERGPGLASAVAAAIDERRLRVEYQPVVDNVIGRVLSVEALVRGEDPVLGAFETGLLVHEARRQGRLHALTEQVLEHAFADMLRLQAIAPELRKVHVNIEVDQMLDPALLALLDRLQSAHPSVELTLEMTENSLDRASIEVMEAMAGLAERGVSFALDDFGQAYSSVLAIVQYRFQVLKIDRSLLHRLQERKSQHVVRALVLLARKLGVQAVVEGVENRAVRDQLAQLGVRYMQGYWFGRPVPVERLAQRLERHGLDEGRASKPALDG